ncbi:adenylyl-sulfate kinase [Vibrio xiamenensis]|nr:adenylyl-sulfate kinase [Vibrio xiamenensis]
MMDKLSERSFQEPEIVDKTTRAQLKSERPILVCFSAAREEQKLALARGMEQKLKAFGCRYFLLDEQTLRHGLCSDLGFSEQDCREYLRRIGHLAKLLIDTQLIVLATVNLESQSEFQYLRDLFKRDEFLQVEIRGVEPNVEPTQSGRVTRARSSSEPEIVLSDQESITTMVEACLAEFQRRNIVV